MDIKIKMDHKSLTKSLDLLDQSGMEMKKVVSRSARDGLKKGRVIAAKGVKASRQFPGYSYKEIFNRIYPNPKKLPTARKIGADFDFYFRPSKRAGMLYRMPFKTKRVPFIRKGGGGKSDIGGQSRRKINQILTSVFGLGLSPSKLNSFFVVGARKKGGVGKGRYFYKGTPKRAEKPIALYRTTDNRKPLEIDRAVSIDKAMEKTPGIHGRIQTAINAAYQTSIVRESEKALRRILNKK